MSQVNSQAVAKTAGNNIGNAYLSAVAWGSIEPILGLILELGTLSYT
jgi:hypothetical protein